MRALDAAAPEDRQAWLAAWGRTGREPFAHPDYVALFADEGARAIALVDEQPAGSVLLPLVLRPVPASLGAPESDALDGPLLDAVSPYGYGGPYADGAVEWRSTYESLLAWMAEHRVVAAFLRAGLEHEAPPWEDLPGYRAVHLADNVRIDLSRPMEEQWRHYAHKVRKNVNKARRAELAVRITEGFADLDAFLRVYGATMDRRTAADRYRFGEHFFATIGALPGCALVVDVLDGDRVVSTELVLVSDRRLYSFLGGTERDAFVHAPNDLLKHAVVERGHELGKEHYVLGGGYEPGDGIFRYKQAFDADGVVPFHGIQLVALPDAYAQLTARAVAAGAPEGGAYFPAYRAG